ncbi:MAG: AraC family transcriptional regulator [Bacilli bacterium]
MEATVYLDYIGNSVSVQTKEIKSDNPLNIVLQMVGHEITGPRYRLSRNNYQSYMLTYVKKGRLEILHDKKAFHLQKGNAILIDCMKQHEAWTSSLDGMEIYFIHFYAPYLADFYRKITSKENLLSDFDEDSFISLCNTLIELTKDRQDYDPLVISDYLISFLLRLKNSPEMNTRTSLHYLDEAVGFISEHFTENLSQERLAKAVNLSTSYLEALFRKELHVGIGSYISTYRFQRASELLSFGTESIKNVASEVGLSTQALIRMFLKKTNVTPKQYRINRVKKID